MSDLSLIEEQTAYYRARAAEYDEWFLREGRYDRGEAHRQKWNDEREVVRSAVTSHGSFSKTLEIACGTGQWTKFLAEKSDSMTAMDAVEETIILNRAKNSDSKIDFVTADVFEWQPTERYDFIFFGFWLSHVPSELFEAFWGKLEKALTPEGKVFFVDSLKAQSAAAHGHQILDDSGIDKRCINSGETFRIVKYFYEPATIEQKLSSLGWSGEAHATDEFFVYGTFQKD